MRRWALPIVLLVVAVVAAGLAWRAEAAPDDDVEPTPDSAELSTPVLSARRVPVWLLRPGGAESLDLALQTFLGETPQPACLVVESGGERIIDLNSTEPLVPASNMKLVVAAAALEQLGGDAVYTTTAASASPIGEDGTLDGDLWLLGGGDPLLGTDDFYAGLEFPDQPRTRLEDLADQLVAQGLTTVTGGVAGDDTRYDNVRTVEDWPERSMTRSTPGAFSALSVNQGFESYPLDPESDGTPEPSDDPPRMAAEVFAQLLADRGVDVQGSAQAAVAPDDLLTLASLDSPPLRDILDQMLSTSDNTTTELVVKEIGFQRSGEGSTEAGTQAIADILGGLGLPMDGVVIEDGSGLHDGDRVTCNLLAGLLERFGPDSDLSEALAVAGENGRLEERFLDSFVSGRLRAKTGTLDESTALSGFVDTLAGLDVVFAYIANGSGLADQVETLFQQQETLGDSLVRYPEGPAIEDLAPLPAVGGDGGAAGPTGGTPPTTTAGG
jgi:D-alanyl-D-alanine carboxypeptidase/D-alanyl-D-alanine-endopeptidase (penicillin-binding protein 4)